VGARGSHGFRERNRPWSVGKPPAIFDVECEIRLAVIVDMQVHDVGDLKRPVLEKHASADNNAARRRRTTVGVVENVAEM
jgi:hypothetical protein